MLDKSTDQRHFDRAPAYFPVAGKLVESIFKSQPFEGQSQNMSYDGLCIRVKSNGFQTGEKIKLRTRLYKDDFLLKITGRIAWVSSQDDNGPPFSMGIQLTRTRHYDLWCKKVDSELKKVQKENKALT